MTLKDWRDLNGYGYREAAAVIKTSHPHLFNIEKGSTSPSVRLMLRIRRATNGLVDFEDIFGKGCMDLKGPR
tara:strand:- start:14790 stop:15005 length:216 start_codon:yes stop_codon:yes gene_type:complete